MVDIADFVPGGISPSDRWHPWTDGGICSRCGGLVSDHDNPLMLFSSDNGDRMLVYCWACLTPVPAANDNRTGGEQAARQR